MSLYDREGLWYYRFKSGGREYRKSTGLAATSRNETAAKAMEKKARLDAKQVKPEIGELVLFSEASETFLAWRKSECKAESTYRRTATSFKSLCVFFGDKPVSQILAGDVEDFKQQRKADGIGGATLRNDLSALSLFRRYAKKKGWTMVNWMEDVERPADDSKDSWHIVSEEDWKKYSEWAKRHSALYDLASLVLYTGMRPDCEALVLAKDCVNLEAGSVTIGKSKTPAGRRTLVLHPEAKAILSRRMIGESPWIFPSSRNPGAPLVKVNGPHDKACDRARVWFRLYDLRHTFATRLAATGIPLITLGKILGHSDLRTLTRYVHPTEDDVRRAMTWHDSVGVMGAEDGHGIAEKTQPEVAQ